MKRFTGHSELWGSFIDIKQCSRPIDVKKLAGKTVFLSSVTDCYNPYEETYKMTQGILQQLISADCQVSISTKSKLILRDLDLLKQLKNLSVSISINTLDESFRSDMDSASTIAERIETLITLYNHGIHTVLFMSPIFPGITDFKAILEETKNYIHEAWFENLNLRGNYRQTIISYVNTHYPTLSSLYQEIYQKKSTTYWEQLSNELDQYCSTHKISYTNYFYHEKLVSQKMQSQT